MRAKPTPERAADPGSPTAAAPVPTSPVVGTEPSPPAVRPPTGARGGGGSPAGEGAFQPAPAGPGGRMTEAELERQVRAILKDVADLAPAGDVLGYHTYFSKASHAGFPDWVFAGPGGILFRELKTAKGHLSLAQVVWRRALRQGGADVDVWRPADLLSGRVAREIAALRSPKAGAA